MMMWHTKLRRKKIDFMQWEIFRMKWDRHVGRVHGQVCGRNTGNKTERMGCGRQRNVYFLMIRNSCHISCAKKNCGTIIFVRACVNYYFSMCTGSGERKIKRKVSPEYFFQVYVTHTATVYYKSEMLIFLPEDVYVYCIRNIDCA